MQANGFPRLQTRTAAGGQVQEMAPGVRRLSIPAGHRGQYRLAQLDDYQGHRRHALPWERPFTFQVRARASHFDIPGTWGFGLWNDPFSFSMGFGGGRWFPALPNAAWFFFASPPNHLSLRDDQPGCGALAQVFRSPRWPSPPFALGLPVVPFLLWSPAARLFRRLARKVVKQESAALELDPTEWHTYSFSWQVQETIFRVDEQLVFSAPLSPQGPLGLVLWVDNQYASFTPAGCLGYGTLENPEPAWIELAEVVISTE